MEQGYLARPAPSGLADVIEAILAKGLVIDAYARVSLLGIEVLTLDARIVVASVDTYLRFAEATNRLDLSDKGGESPVDLLTEGVGKTIENVAGTVAERKVEGVKDSAKDSAKKAAGAVGGAVRKASDTVEDVAGGISEKVADATGSGESSR